MANPAFPPNSLILITGGTGLIGSHTIDQTLKAGLRVRAAVRTVEKGDFVKEFFGKTYPGKIETVIVEDMANDDAYVDAVKGVDGIIHLASVLPRSSVTYDDIIPPSVAGATSILKAAAKEPSVKRVVLTSSNVAAGLNSADGPVKHWDSNTWNTETKATKDETNGMILYTVSKIEAERAAWAFVEREKPSFVLNTILPNMNFGRLFPGFTPSSGALIGALHAGQSAYAAAIPPQWFINVTDDALLHVLVLQDSTIVGERILAVSEPASWNDVVRAIRKVKPDTKANEADFGEAGEKKPQTTIDFEKAKALLAPYGGLKDLETTVREALEG